MRSAILQLPPQRAADEQRRVLREAIRQIDRAEIYVAAVGYMDLDERAAKRAVARIRADLQSLEQPLSALRVRANE